MKKPDYLAVAFDKGRVTFRHAEFADYKAQRAATPEDLRPQFALIKQVLRAMGIPVFELDNYEADDLIGTLTLLGEKQGMHAVIVSGDKDMLQLVDDNTDALSYPEGNHRPGPLRFSASSGKVWRISAAAIDRRQGSARGYFG